MITHTHVLFVTDMSGSMADKATDVRGGFNEYIDGLRVAKEADPNLKFRVTVTLFDDVQESFCVDAKLRDVPAMTTENYRPRASTALLDAVGDTISAFKEKHPVLEPDHKVILIIQTDGMENASRRRTYDEVALMLSIAEREGWVVLYLGQGRDAWRAGDHLGTRVVRTNTSGVGTRSSYGAAAQATTAYAGGQMVNTSQVADWMEEQPGVKDDTDS